MRNNDIDDIQFSSFGSKTIALNYLQETITKKLKEIRENLKISFIGRVSTGKSSIINSILGIDLLPVSSGQTTLYSIFISGIIDNIIRVKQGKENWKIFKSIVEVKNYLLEIQNENILKLKINLPISNYKILEKCSLIDNPAIGYSDELDEYVLNQSYRSCYLYVLVIDAVASISSMEQNFFAELLKKRRIIELKILLNITDCVKYKELQILLTRYEESIKTFLFDKMFVFSGCAFTENKIAKIFENDNCNISKKDSTTVNENLFDPVMSIKNIQVIEFLRNTPIDKEIEKTCEKIKYLKINHIEPNPKEIYSSLDSKIDKGKPKRSTIWYA